MMTPDQQIARATELSLEQQDRFDGFKLHFHLDDPTTSVVAEFYKENFEANQAFLITKYLKDAYEQQKAETTKTTK